MSLYIDNQELLEKYPGLYKPLFEAYEKNLNLGEKLSEENIKVEPGILEKRFINTFIGF